MPFAISLWPGRKSQIAFALDFVNEFIIYTALFFGFTAAPLLLGRLAALNSLLLQRLFAKGEACLQTYMDDPLFILAGPISRRNKALEMALCTLWAFGVNIAYAKGERGLRVTWIGVVFELDLPQQVIKLTVSQKMSSELLLKLKSLEGVGMIGGRERAGCLGWRGSLHTPDGLSPSCMQL